MGLWNKSNRPFNIGPDYKQLCCTYPLTHKSLIEAKDRHRKGKCPEKKPCKRVNIVSLHSKGQLFKKLGYE